MTASLPLVFLFAAAAALSLYELFRTDDLLSSYLASREAHAAHVVMNGAMAAMFAPGYGSTLQNVVFWLLIAAGTILLARFVLAVRCGDKARAGTAAYHALAMFAMVYAMSLMPEMDMHHGHHGHMTSYRTWPGLLLGILFIVDMLATLVVALFFPARSLADATNVSKKQVAVLRRSAIPHVIMDAGMALMLL